MTGKARDWQAARCLPGLVSALRRLGRAGEAREWAARAVVIETELEAPYELTGVLDEQARLLWDTDPGWARDLHLQDMTIRRDIGLRARYADSLDALAGFVARAGHHRQRPGCWPPATPAGRHGLSAATLDLPGHEALLTSLRASLGQEAFEEG